jgi:hypothetical protein
MGQAMPPQITVPSKHLPTCRTVVRFDVRVSEQMGLEVRPLIERPATHRTLVRRLFHVEDFVDGEGAGLAETLAAFRALEGLFFAVYIPERSKYCQIESQYRYSIPKTILIVLILIVRIKRNVFFNL